MDEGEEALSISLTVHSRDVDDSESNMILTAAGFGGHAWVINESIGA